MTTGAVATRDQPLIAIDVVPMSFTTSDGLRVATARRAYDPYAGQEALPGVLLDAAELLADGARRALRTKAGIDDASVRHLAQVGAFDGPERDPRDAAISIAFVAVVAPDRGPRPPVGADVTPVWRPAVGGERGLPFDHDTIIRTAVDQVRALLWRDVPLTRALLGDVFTTSAAAQLHAALHGAPPDAGNLNRALRTNPALARLEAAPSSTRRGGRPPASWAWTD